MNCPECKAKRMRTLPRTDLQRTLFRCHTCGYMEAYVWRVAYSKHSECLSNLAFQPARKDVNIASN